MKPYYEDENGVLYCGDCLEVMPKLGIKVDAVITDPPYEISNSGGGMMERNNRNFIKEIDKMNMCKSNFNADLFLNSLIKMFENKNKFCGIFYCSKKQLLKYLSFAENNNFQNGVGVWHKTNPAPLCNYKYLNDIEYWVYIKGNKSKILGEYKTKSMVYTSAIDGILKKKYQHPTVKPTKMIENFLLNHTLQNNIVLDPFVGSGTTAIACMNTNRKYICIEKEEKYCEIAKNRIIQHKEKSNGK